MVMYSEINLFPFIGPEHPFYAPIQNLKTQLLATPLYQKMTQKISAGGETRVRISMRAHPASNSVWVLKGFYLSLQFKERLSPPLFHSSTFSCSAKKGAIESYEFPQDPYLTALASYFKEQNLHKNSQETSFDLDVLRYYPRQRLTFRTITPDKNITPVIGKFVRTSKVEETYDKLAKISRVVAGSHATFSAASPMGIEANTGLFFQEAKAGKALADLITKENHSDLLHAVGVIHRDLHSLKPPESLPKLDFSAFLRSLITCIEWISFCRPEERSFFDRVSQLLVKQVPRVNPAEYTFCHGDFSCLQIIKDDDSYSLIDFDDCMLGDPYLEIARLMAFLKYDVPLFRNYFIDPEQGETELIEEGCEAYLNGYQEKAQQNLNQKRLLWYRICFEIHYLARLFKRDLFHSLAFDRTVKIIHDLSERFQKGGEDS